MVAQICLRYKTRYCYGSDYDNYDCTTAIMPLDRLVAEFSKQTNINDCLNNHCLVYIFELLSTQDLLSVSLVCHHWYVYGRYVLDKIRHLKITSPRNFELAPCQYAPVFKCCSMSKYFCTEVKMPYDEIQYRHFQYDSAFQTDYYKQIYVILERTSRMRITILDVFDCSLSSLALSLLLKCNRKYLEYLSLDSVKCLHTESCADVWKQINSLSSLKALALHNIGPFMPKKLPILGNLEEFHNDGCARRYLSSILLQLGIKFRKLSLPFEFPIECFEQWFAKKPSAVARLTHLKLLLNPQMPHLEFACTHFLSLTHLYLVVDDDQALYLSIFRSLSNFPKLHHLELSEYPHGQGTFTSMLNANYSSLASSSLKVLHFDVYIKQYRKLATLNWVLPELSEISIKRLDFVDCDCFGELNRGNLAQCTDCRRTLKSLLSKVSKVHRVYGLDIASNHPEEQKRKCRYRWL